MKLHSPSLEKSLVREIRKATRASPSLIRQAKQSRKVNGTRSRAWLGFLFVTLLPVVLTAMTIGSSGHPITGLAFLSLLLVAFAVSVANSLWTALHAHQHLSVLHLLPIPAEGIFRWQTQGAIRRQFPHLIGICGALCAFALYAGIPLMAWAALVPLGLLAWLSVLACGLLCAAFVPPRQVALVNAAVWTCGFLLLISNKLVGSHVLRLIDSNALQIMNTLPTGWSLQACLYFLGRDPATIILPVLASVALAGTIGWSWTRMRLSYVKASPEPDPVITWQDGDEPEAHASALPDAPLVEIEAALRTRAFLEAGPWAASTGPLEKWLWQWFTPRERVLSEFAFFDAPSISRSWVRITKTLVFAIAITLACSFILATAKIWVVLAGLLAVVFQVMKNMLDNGAAFRVAWTSNGQVPQHALYGIGYEELSQLLVKVSLIQVPLALSAGAATGCFAAMALGSVWWGGALMGAKIALLFFPLRYISLVFAFSAESNDTTGLRPRQIAVFLILMLGALLFLGAGVVSIFWPTPMVAWMWLIVTVVIAVCFHWLYGKVFNANWFDVTKIPTSS